MADSGDLGAALQHQDHDNITGFHQSDIKTAGPGVLAAGTPLLNQVPQNSRLSEMMAIDPELLAVIFWVWNHAEKALWAIFVAISYQHNFYWTVTSISFLVERLCCILLPWSLRRPWIPPPFRKFFLKCGVLLSFLTWTVWCCSLTPLHLFTPTFMDLWATYSNHPPLEAIRVLHDPRHSVLVDVFAIHGLGSNPDSAWTARRNETEVRWLRDILPRLEGGGEMRVVMINHQTRWDANTANMRFEEHAAMMLEDIENLRKGDSKRPIIFIAHSFGGLLLKKTLIEARKRSSEIAEHTTGLLFLGVPHGGSKAAFWASLLSCTAYWRGSSTSLLEYMSVDGAAVKDLEAEFFDIYVLRGASNDKEFRPYICDFFEARSEKIKMMVLGPTVDGIVGNPRHGHRIYLDTDHRGMNKFFSADDPSFQRFHPEFRKAFALAAERVRKPIKGISHNSSKLFYSALPKTVLSYTERNNLSILLGEKIRKYQNEDLAHAVAIYGLGGTGKTQLALRYVESHIEEYNPILWIDAESEETVRSSFKECARLLGLSIENEHTQSSTLKNLPAVQAVLDWFRKLDKSGDEWLVVIDNADDPTLDIRHIIPKGQRGSVIVISRDDQSSKLFDRRCERLRVDIMEPSEASSLLLRHVEVDDRSRLQEVQDLASKIADRLGYLALAVDLAGAYIGAADDTKDKATTALQTYLIDYERHQNELLKSDGYGGLSSYNKTVWTVWDTSLEAIKTRYPEAPSTLLLSFLAYLGRSNIQDELFRLASLGLSELAESPDLHIEALPDWLQDLMIVPEGKEWDSFRYREALRPLIRYSLLQPTKGEWPGVTMHSLVQWKAKEHKNDNRWDLWYLSFITYMSYEMGQDVDRPQFRQYAVAHLPQPTMLGAEYLPFDDYSRSVIWSVIGTLYDYVGRWKEAEKLFLQVVETMKRILGPEHPKTLSSMDSLASTYRKQGRWKNAEKLQEQVMETKKRFLGLEHPSTLKSMNNLALTYQHQWRWKEAEKLQASVVKTSSNVLGAEHPDTLTSMNTLSLTFQNRGRYREAEALQKQVFESRKRLLGINHPSTLNTMDILALTYQNQGKWKKAEELLVEEVEIVERLLGAENPDTLKAMNNLALTYQNQGRWKDAEELQVKLLPIVKRVLGQEHPSTLKTMHNLAGTYYNQNRLRKAEELQLQTLEKQERQQGVGHPDTLAAMNSLAATYDRQGRWKEAEELYMQALEASRMVLGPKDRYTLRIMDNLAIMYRNQGQWEEAEELQVQILKLIKMVLGREHPETLEIMASLASTYRNQGKRDKAEDLDMEVMRIRQKIRVG